jgi:hypothetical protein
MEEINRTIEKEYRLTETEEIIATGLFFYYDFGPKAVYELLKVLDKNNKITFNSVKRRRKSLNNPDRLKKYKNQLGSKSNFEIFLKSYFESKGVTITQETLKRFKNPDNFKLSDLEKTLIIGMADVLGLSIVSITRIFKARGKRSLAWGNTRDLYNKYKRSETDIDLKDLGQEKLISQLAAYFSFDSAEDCESFLNSFRKEQSNAYSDKEKKLVYGLYKYSGYTPASIAKLLKKSNSALSEVTRKEVGLLIIRISRDKRFTVSKEEFESIVGLSTDQLGIIFGEIAERKNKAFTDDEKRFIVGWVESIGSVTGLKNLFSKYWNYNPTNARQISTTVFRLKSDLKRRGIVPYNKQEMERKLADMGLTDLNKIKYEFELDGEERGMLSLLNGDSLKGRFTEVEISLLKLYISHEKTSPEIARDYFSGNVKRFKTIIDRFYLIAKNSVIESVTENKKVLDSYKVFAENDFCKEYLSKVLSAPLSKDILLPFTINISKGKTLLNKNGMSGLGKVIFVRLIVPEDSKKDNEQLKNIKNQVKGIAYILSRPGKLKKVLDYWGSKGLKVDGIVLEVFESGVSSGLRQSNVKVFENKEVAIDAELESISS